MSTIKVPKKIKSNVSRYAMGRLGGGEFFGMHAKESSRDIDCYSCPMDLQTNKECL